MPLQRSSIRKRVSAWDFSCWVISPSSENSITGSLSPFTRQNDTSLLMQILPAIDLRNGKCVRLKQGDYSQETIFGEDPGQMAARWVEQGAERLHLVDLDGAKAG